MPEILETWAPNLANYWSEFTDSLWATLQMFFFSGILSLIIGGAIGIGLVITRKNNLYPNRIIHTLLEVITNVCRSVPFIILLIFLIPFTRLITGTAIGVKGAIVPLVIGCVPFFSRQVESALSEVDPGKIEAARAMGKSRPNIIWNVYLHEAVPGLLRAITITAISLIGLTTAAGAVGAGGIGSFAINYGQNLHYQDIVNVCVLVLLGLISLIQLSGNALSIKASKGKLIRLPKRTTTPDTQSFTLEEESYEI